ncbi:hypothetical protein E5163_00500 [Marinicauda algicola]|uniref:PRC-barrel domain containing protein n=1 Tax=Marinicauda algicola TaxID=2029849 RepID=A0A4S2H2T8_9PROT|nr:hypothetical protein [Marinicauda algicola]TGY89658.1 hypothetical protein E5163_00500 [Marinicauda algicola]
MNPTLLPALAAALAASPAALAQLPPELADETRDAELAPLHDPRVGAEVRTPAGDLVGRVSRLEFETAARSVVKGYLVDVTDLTGREPFQLYVSDEDAVWTDLAGTPVLQLSMTMNDLEEVPDFSQTRPAAFQFDDRWTGDVAVEEDPLLDSPDAASARVTGEPQTLYGPGELTAQIEWDTGFQADELTRNEWGDMTAFTPQIEPFGVVTEVRSQDGDPARLVVQTLPDYYDLGVLLVFDIADIEAVSQSDSALCIDPAKGREA